MRTALILGRTQEQGRLPFSMQPLLFKPICLYPADAARAGGWECVSLLLPPQDLRLTACFPEGTAAYTYDSVPEAAFSASDDVLLLSDDAVSLTPAQLRKLTAHGRIVLSDGERLVAAVVGGAQVQALTDADSVLRLPGLPHCSAEDLFGKSYRGFAGYTKRALFELSEHMRMEILYRWMDAGVTLVSADGVVVGPDVRLGADTVLLPGTELRGHTCVGKNCVLGPNTIVADSRIGDDCVVEASKLTESVLHDRVRVGPFSQLRPGSELADGVKLGDFVEVKNSRIGAETSISHLTYVGDSDVGKKVNFGCGVVTCNYDGLEKHRTVVGDGAFVGCNTNLVAPVTVGAGAYTAAGTTVTWNVPANALAIGRARQENHENWVKKFRRRKGNGKNDRHI